MKFPLFKITQLNLLFYFKTKNYLILVTKTYNYIYNYFTGSKKRKKCHVLGLKPVFKKKCKKIKI